MLHHMRCPTGNSQLSSVTLSFLIIFLYLFSLRPCGPDVCVEVVCVLYYKDFLLLLSCLPLEEWKQHQTLCKETEEQLLSKAKNLIKVLCI